MKGFPLLFPPLYPLYENTGLSRGNDQSLRTTVRRCTPFLTPTNVPWPPAPLSAPCRAAIHIKGSPDDMAKRTSHLVHKYTPCPPLPGILICPHHSRWLFNAASMSFRLLFSSTNIESSIAIRCVSPDDRSPAKLPFCFSARYTTGINARDKCNGERKRKWYRG